MGTGIIIVMGLAAVVILVLVLLFFLLSSDSARTQAQLRRMSTRGQRYTPQYSDSKGNSEHEIPELHELDAIESKTKKSGRLSLRKKLVYAQWKLPPTMYRALEIVLSLIAFAIFNQGFNLAVQLVALFFFGPFVMGTLLGRSMRKRSNRFDADYPQMLLSLVGLLKTGMNPMSALESTALGLDPNSLVREEILLMLERTRYGISEDASIGSFGETIHHPEIELFVQALLLSRKVGGTLSHTLERIARQARKRQFFRQSAISAIALQRGSVWVIIFILFALELYMYFVYREAVVGAWADELGWEIWQYGILVILGGIVWVNQVTKIKI